MTTVKHHAKKHVWYYSSMLVLLAVGFSLVVLAAPNKLLQFIFLAATAVAYVAWALSHHHHHHGLTAKIVIEYVLMVALGLAISLFLFNA